jgi:hypothetical protein
MLPFLWSPASERGELRMMDLRMVPNVPSAASSPSPDASITTQQGVSMGFKELRRQLFPPHTYQGMCATW